MSISKIQAVVRQIRDLVNSDSQATLSSRQAKSLKRRPSRDTEWVERYLVPAPEENDLLSVLLQAIKDLGDGGEDFLVPDIEPVDVEWVCPRGYHGGGRFEQQCESLERDCSPQIMYVHGGGYFQGSIDESRGTAATLARLSGGRCLSVGYRLAPQHPFPAAILDTLLVYLSLLHPPSGSPHKPIPATSVVLCGDSAGAAICLAVLQVIVQAQRRSQSHSPQIWFHGEQVLLQLPAGLAAVSAYGDMTHSMPSWLANVEKDYMPPINPTLLPGFPDCDIWPTKPPQVNALCNVTVLHHPLVSPVAVADWTGFPPLWLCFGEEMMADEGKFIAQRAAQRAVPVVWEQYGAMPHCFVLLPPLNRLPQAQKVFEKWADFCKACVEQPKAIKVRGRFTSADGMQETSVDVENQLGLSFEEVKQRMEKARMEAAELLTTRKRSRIRL